MFPDKRPSFFKIIFDDLATEQLRIPPHFLKHLPILLSDRVTLKGPSGSCWHAKLRQTANGMFLLDGWRQFFKDHSLGDNEFLLFRYEGNMCFDVQIFDKSGCERVDASIFRSYLETALPTGKRKRGRPRKYPFGFRSHQESVLPTEKRKRGRPRKHPVVSPHLHPSKPSENGQLLQFYGSKKLEKFKEERDGQGKIGTEETESLLLEMESKVMKVKEEKDAQSKMEVKTEETELPIQVKDSKLKKLKKGDNQMKIEKEETDSHAPTEEDKAMAQKAAKYFTSELPHFTITLRRAAVNKVFILTVPSSFSRTHLPPFKTRILLRNSKGKSWVVNSIPNKGKHFLCGGWTAFVRGNKLKEGDICIFELVDRNEMQVHIFPLVLGS